MEKTNENPTVAVLYSYDDDQHREWVEELVNKLKENKVYVNYDHDKLNLGDDINQFMELLVSNSDILLPICTKKYKSHIDQRENGSGYEGRMLAQVIKDKTHKVIPIYKDEYANDKTPNCLMGINGVILNDQFNDKHFGDLLKNILDLKIEKKVITKDPRETIAELMNVDIKEVKSKQELNLVNVKILGIVTEKVTQPTLDGSRGSALYDIPFKLNTQPPRDWDKFFIYCWRNPSSFTTMHRPSIASVSFDEIWLKGTTMDEVAEYHRDTLISSVNAANKMYNDRIIEEEKLRIEKEKKKMEFRKMVNEKSKGISF
ncbi:toll/interleukin-1 receptor domain-containing protein [Liquorilactobacillus hordei]|uniref:SEFIR domain-containing protein n=1 Tax=Liquorilactobacillus hordei DSM 19519 TaxID=1423759 RepID=A0A0R1MWM9_9LACO|nr:toll/interleukin-1 receptor domain-containing protein [Liquorilactobacillus hordei]KRL07992.1 hypothetical protein FC92_GL001063 [Liquorilactobacillus hordei DSM 19519]QYH51064.1 TIR domain-containing protein [Liquorilactobacillus hordei DSM 19519]